jgi:RNA methyltransferase, TrmH family
MAFILTKAEVARVRGWRERAAREAEGRFVVEGPKVVGELLAAGMAFEVIYATEAWAGETAGGGGAQLRRVTEAEMARISHYPTPSCVLAVGRITRAVAEQGELARGLTLALDGIQDPGNVGTLVRLADWFGCARVWLGDECADLFSQKVINASMGSFARVRVLRGALAPALREARAAGVAVLGADLGGESVYGLGAVADAVLVVGSEGRGPSEAVRAELTRRVTIPRVGGAESLNAAVAAGIVLAELRRQR